MTTQLTTENVAILALHIGKLTLQRDYAQATLAANAAILAFPDCAGLYALRGNLYALVERYDKARLDFDTAVAISPTPHYYLRRAAFFLQIGDCMEALQDCQEALRIAPDNRHALCSLEAVQKLMHSFLL